MRTKTIALFVAILLTSSVWLCATPAAAGDKLQILICYPGGSVRARDAKPAMDNMVGVLESIGGWPQGTIETSFTSRLDECREMLAEKKPPFAIMSLGLFLEKRGKYHMKPLAQPTIDGRKTDVYRILVRKGSYANLEALKGKKLSGPWLTEEDFLKRIIFKNSIDPKKFFELKPSRRALRSLRKLARGKLDAVIVNQRQYESLSSLPFAGDLEAVFTSDELPQMGVVFNAKLAKKVDRDRLLKGLGELCGHAKGKKLCELFGIDAFAASRDKTYKKVIDLWQSGK